MEGPRSRPNDPVGAADDSVLVRQTIRGVVAEVSGLRASFAPSVVAGYVGNGGHVHLSLWRGRQETCCPAGTGRYKHDGGGRVVRRREFSRRVAGRLLAVGSPSVGELHIRLVPSHWAGAYQVWGRENREGRAGGLVTGLDGRAGHPGEPRGQVASTWPRTPYLVIGFAAGGRGWRARVSLPDETRR